MRFRKYANAKLNDIASAEALLLALRRDADTFRGFADLNASTASGRFYSRVVEGLELGATIPLLLWLISDNHALPDAEVSRALSAVESWVVRRTLLRAMMKDVNRLVIALIKHLDSLHGRIGDGAASFLVEQSADSRYWPTDEQLIEGLPATVLYGNVRQNRLGIVLTAIERKRRSERNEDVTLPSKLQIEHVMPQKWRTHWSDGLAADPVASARRDRLVHTIGNLTLVTGNLNASLSNRPWRDSDAVVVAPTGPEAGKGKRSLIDKYSLLVLNKEIVQQHLESWSEDDIKARGLAMTKDIAAIWPRG